MAAWSPEFIHALLAALLEAREGGRETLIEIHFAMCHRLPGLNSSRGRVPVTPESRCPPEPVAPTFSVPLTASPGTARAAIVHPPPPPVLVRG